MIDSELIARGQEGDARALSQIYEQLCVPVFRFVSYRVGTREDAEDIAQETMLAAIKSINSFRGDAKFINWCYEIAKRKIADHWRARYKVDITEWEETLNLSTVQHHAEDDAEIDAHTQAIDKKVKELLNGLPENYAAVLTLRFLKGYSLKETADELGISLSNAKVIQHRAIKKASALFHQ
ncbi:MAG: RNA polymerase sigma factor [Candidatus Kerfeldbacteria bacterium]|nr:RNA polymerase sigma factor [Candidatus Kerfeldbacteria bacterium]